MASRRSKKNNKRNLIIAAVVLIVFAGIVFLQHNKNIKIKSANIRYLRQYVRLEQYIFKKIGMENQGLVKGIVDNSGNRVLDSVPIEIRYYGHYGQLLDVDEADILKFTKDIIFPENKKIFEVNVVYPDGTEDAKVAIKH